MFRKTSKLLVYAIALLLPLVAGIAVVMAKPAQQTPYSYYFAGKVEVYNQRALPSRRLDVQISCDGLVTTTIQSDLDWNWSGMLNLPTDMATCDVQLLLPPGYQGATRT